MTPRPLADMVMRRPIERRPKAMPEAGAADIMRAVVRKRVLIVLWCVGLSLGDPLGAGARRKHLVR